MSLTEAPHGASITPEDLWSALDTSRFDALTDRELVTLVAAAVAVPRRDPADSFVLHAPLEVTARTALLPGVHPSARRIARLRLVALAGSYESWGPPVPEPTDADTFADAADAARWLVSAIDRGDLEGVDGAARWLGRSATPGELRRLLTGDVVLRTAAAAHAPIFLYHLPRVATGGELTGELLRGLARQLARNPDWRLHWIDHRPPTDGVTADAFLDAMTATPRLGVPGSTFIFPLMDQVDSSGVAADVLAEVTGGRSIGERARVLLRVAAWSMLQEPPEHAAYGWTHCLTIPQSILGTAASLSDPSVALAAASTHVLGFRAALATRDLDPGAAPEAPQGPAVDPTGAWRTGPDQAAATAWHLPVAQRPALWRDIVTAAAIGHDAHLVKYVLACRDATRTDPTHEHLYLAAAAYLAAWWHEHPDPTDPFLGR